MNLATFRLRIMRTVGVAAGSAGDEQTLVDGWVNDAVVQFLAETKVLKQTASLPLVAGVGDYTIDPLMLAFEDPYIDPGDGSQEYMLKPVDTYDIRRLRRFQGATAGPVTYYAYEGQTIMLYPNPTSSTDTMHVVYVPYPTSSLSATGDDPSTLALGGIPKAYHPILEAYGKWKAAEYSSDSPSQNGQVFKKEWEEGVIKARVKETKKAGVKTAYAVPGRRSRQIPLSPGVDIREA